MIKNKNVDPDARIAGKVLDSVQTLAAAGNSQGTSGIITSVQNGLVHATGADGTKGVILPTALPGMKITVKNADAAAAILKVYPATGAAINAIAANSAISMAASTCCDFHAISATLWVTVPLLPS